MITEQIADISWGTCMAKGQPQSAYHLDFVQSLLQSMYVRMYVSFGLPGFLSQGVMLCHWEYSKQLYICGIPSPHDTANVCTTLAPHVMMK